MNGDCVKKYGRDDVNPQLKCQRRILRAIGSGWRPVTPLNRGVSGLEEDAEFLDTCLQRAGHGLAEPDCTESESEQSADEGVPQHEEADECDSDQDDGCAEPELCVEDQGPWILNALSGVFHKAVKLPLGVPGLEWSNATWGRACRPKDKLSGHNSLTHADPFLEGFQPCGHSGCFHCQES